MVKVLLNLETNVQKANEWLNEIMKALGFQDKRLAFKAFKGTLHAIRNRLTPAEAANLGAELPILIRGIYYEGWKPSGKPQKFYKEDFVNIVHSYLNFNPNIDPEVVVRAILQVLQKKLADGEIEDIKNSWPEELKRLWPEKEIVR